MFQCFNHLRRISMEAYEVEASIAEGEQALQALVSFVREKAGQLEAHEAEKGIFNMWWATCGRPPMPCSGKALRRAKRGSSTS
jgi:hypothetical protein